MSVPPSNAVKVSSETERFGAFYLPSFKIHLKPQGSPAPGTPLPPDVARDVMQVTYKDNVNEIDSFELTVNNWDATARSFKYTGIEGLPDLPDERAKYLGIFDPGREVEVWMGYGSQLRLMLTGEIKTVEPNFPAAGVPTLAVRGLNVLDQLRGKPYTDFWPKEGAEVRDSDIAKDIGHKVDGGKKRFPLPIRIDDNARNKEVGEPHVLQRNQNDIVFLLSRARRHGYVILVEENNQREKFLYFGPSEGQALKRGTITYLLEWGKSLIQFKPTLTIAKQIGSVTVRGWDRRTKKVIEETVKRSDLKINRDLGDLDKSFNQREEIVAHKPVHNPAQAKALAHDILKNQLKEMVKGSGSTVGLPDLRAGCKVYVDGLGKRFSGTYFVTDTTHAIGETGYQTTFNARREQGGDAP